MPALNIKDLNNGKQDLDHIAEVATSANPTATDRFGKVKLTIRGAINSLKAFNHRGAFAAGTLYAMKDVYVSGGIAYVALLDHVSTTVAADLAAGRVSIHQGATREDLAASGGSALMGFILDGVGAIATTIQDVLRERVSVTRFGAKGDWDNAAGVGSDDTVAFQKALDHCRTKGKALFIPASGKEYKVSGTLYPKGVKIYGDGEMNTRIRYTGNGTLFKGTDNVRNGVTEIELFDFVLRDISLLGPGKAAGVKGIEGDTYRCNFERYPIGEFYTGIETLGAIVKIGKGRVYGCAEGVAVRPLKIGWPATTTTIEAHCDNCDIGVWIDHKYNADNATRVWPQTSGYGGASSVMFKNSVNEKCGIGYKINRASGVLFLNSYAEMCTKGYDVDESTTPTFIIHTEYANTNASTVQYNALAEIDKGYNEIGLWGINATRLFVGGVNSKGGANSPFQGAASGTMPGRNLRGYFSGGHAFLSDPDATTKDIQWWGLGGTAPIPKKFVWSLQSSNTRLQLDSYTDAGAFAKNIMGIEQTTGKVSFGTNTPNAALQVTFNGAIGSAFDNAHTLGVFNLRWSTIYAGTGTINTSDEREKQLVQPIDAAALRAWAKVQYCQFKFNDAVESKGDGARWHFGVIAQRVKEAFESEGLDAFAYGVLCYDEWEAEPEIPDDPEVLDEEGNVISPAVAGRPARPAGNRYGIRYEEALVLECALLRSCLPVGVPAL
jgi:hypothetical protein